MSEDHPGDTAATGVPGPAGERVPIRDGNPLEEIMAPVDAAAQLVELDPGTYRVLRHPERPIVVEQLEATTVRRMHA